MARRCPYRRQRDRSKRVPTISVFYGIVIQMFWRDHAPPHFHALYAEYEALIDLRNFSVIRGSLPGRAMALVLEWLTITAMNCWRIGIYAAECKRPNRSNP
jgi:hypothetical protein